MSENKLRPFYVIAHRCNVLDDVRAQLSRGANAIECDVNDIPWQNDETGLCVRHDVAPTTGGTGLLAYLQGVRSLLGEHPQLALVIFDCKVSNPDQAWRLLKSIREHLTVGTDLNVLISVGSYENRGFFSRIYSQLLAREGIAIDQDGDPVKVSTYFANTLHINNHGYGNGTFEAGLDFTIDASMERAVALKASLGQTKLVYSWTLADPAEMRHHLRIGVDGIFVNDTAVLREILRESEFQSVNPVRLARRDENPFVLSTPAYALEVVTKDVGGAGSDANITFRLEGSLGQVSKAVSGTHRGRFESGSKTHVTLHGVDVGVLKAISVWRDDSGNSPDWYLDDIGISHRGDSLVRRAKFNQWLQVPYAPLRGTFGMDRYRLRVRTGNVQGAGTDASIRFVLQGDRDRVELNVDARPAGLFEKGNVNDVVLQGNAIGDIQSLLVSLGRQGNAPDWYLDSIEVTEELTGRRKRFIFKKWISAGTLAQGLLSDWTYTLKVKTSTRFRAGTDALITFDLQGTMGRISQTVNGWDSGYFEQGTTTDVVLTGEDIGAIQSLTIFNDGAGNGPDWYVDTIEAEPPGGGRKTFAFNQWVNARSRATGSPVA
jgi:hypothetical protein